MEPRWLALLPPSLGDASPRVRPAAGDGKVRGQGYSGKSSVSLKPGLQPRSSRLRFSFPEVICFWR